MAVYPGNKDGATGLKSNVTIPILIVAVVLLAALMGWLYHANFAPQKVTLDAQGQKNQNMLKQIAQKCQGDYSKLSPEDKAKVEALCHGYGAVAIRNLYAGK